MKSKPSYISYSLFLAFVVLLFFVNAYNLTINSRPHVIHQWRQSDCLSITTNYLKEGMHFFQPKAHWQGNGDGGAVSEMPLINYSVAFLWKLFGKSEGIYRLFNHLIFIFGMFVLFKGLWHRTGDRWLSFFLVSLLLTSPLLAYYSFNFLSDVSAFALAGVSFCCLLRAHDEEKKWPLYLSILSGTIAALLKASDAFVILLIAFLFVLEATGISKKWGLKPIFKTIALPLFVIVLALLSIFTWYAFAKKYNAMHSSDLFLVSILPIWEMDAAAILTNLASLFTDKFSIFHNRPMLFLLLVSNFYIWYNFKLLDVFLKLTYVLTGLYFIGYLLLFFKVFDNHDYYLINLMIFPLINFFCIGEIFKKKGTLTSSNNWLLSGMMLLVLFNSLYAAAFYRSRTIRNDKLCSWYPFLSPLEKEISAYQIWTYEQTMNILELVEPKFRELGIPREELVLSVPDLSPNNSLYLFDQKGYTVSYSDFIKDTSWISHARYKACKYLIINDTAIKRSKSFALIKDDLSLLFAKQRLEIYKLETTR